MELKNDCCHVENILSAFFLDFTNIQIVLMVKMFTAQVIKEDLVEGNDHSKGTDGPQTQDNIGKRASAELARFLLCQDPRPGPTVCTN